MDLLIQYFDLILIIIVAICGMIFATCKWLSQPSSKQKEQIRVVLLELVILSEKLYGSKTGQIKRAYVIKHLISLFPYLRHVPVSLIDSLIEESLETMRKMLESNVEIKKFVEGE